MAQFQVVPAPRRLKDWDKRRVRSRERIHTGSTIIPAGRMGTIDVVSTRRLMVNFDPCDCCGVTARLLIKDRDDRRLVEFIEPIE